ncbi:alpha/beta hydrolase [uncultured Nitratireductor sp.]|uniref:alpha/beta fold hydrolase n=1 Tax=uncultured Nitratireductor sp. TaxID=520953 RepID=UPI0025E71A2F|nr:alpha/beta hydrolase [uncultured Nitratireductor sp.]
MNFLADQEFDAFDKWHDRYGKRFATNSSLHGYPVPVLQYANWRLLDTECINALDHDLHREIEERIRLRRTGRNEQCILHGDDLLILHDTARDRSTGFVVIVSPDALEWFLAQHFPNARPTPALLRLTACYLGGLSLSEGARLDGKSVETRKSQARELRQRLDLERTEDVQRIVGGQLIAALSAMLTEASVQSHDVFERYRERYLPEAVRCLVLSDSGNKPFRILDMGPKAGTPLIVLHAMILPDIRQKDIALLDELGLRLIWPLRNGLYAPDDPTFSEDEQIRHACHGIDLVRRVFCEEKIHILSLAASSKVAIAYARKNAENIDALFFAAACVLEGRPVSGARRLAKGMLALASRNETLMSATMDYFRRTILTPARFPAFIRGQFQASRADSLIVEAELAGPHGGERFREALIHSIPSARHDFGFQRALDWDLARALGIETHFLHGDDDPIHPLPLIRTLVESFSEAHLHVIEKAGQLLYHDHLRDMLTPIAARIRG